MPEALEAEKRDALKFTSGIENQKPRAVMLFGALFLPLFMALLMVPQSSCHFSLLYRELWRKRCP